MATKTTKKGNTVKKTVKTEKKATKPKTDKKKVKTTKIKATPVEVMSVDVVKIESSTAVSNRKNKEIIAVIKDLLDYLETPAGVCPGGVRSPTKLAKIKERVRKL